jgi:hypothetical protein
VLLALSGSVELTRGKEKIDSTADRTQVAVHRVSSLTNWASCACNL